MSRKILILSRNDNHGDGLMAYRIAKCLIEAGYEVAMVVRHKTKTDLFIHQVDSYKTIFRRIFEGITRKFFGDSVKNLRLDNKYDFAPNQETQQYIESEVILKAIPFVPDVILSGLTSLLANTTTFSELKTKTGAEIYSIMIDMAPLTGGCHHAWDCTGYQRQCKSCPAILTESEKDLAHKNFMIKLKNVRESDLKIIAGSGHTYRQAKKSTLFKDQEPIYNINSVIDTKVFNSRKRKYAKDIFDIPSDLKVIFAGAEYTNNERKGFKYFIESLKLLWELSDETARKKTLVLIAGKDKSLMETDEVYQQIPFNKLFIDFISDERLLSIAYQAADVFVCPSVEDPGPVMVSQALACGTPVAAFDTGIAADMVINGFNGYKAEMKNSESLAGCIFEILSLLEEAFKEYSRNAVLQIEKYSSQEIVVEVASQILSGNQ